MSLEEVLRISEGFPEEVEAQRNGGLLWQTEPKSLAGYAERGFDLWGVVAFYV